MLKRFLIYTLFVSLILLAVSILGVMIRIKNRQLSEDLLVSHGGIIHYVQEPGSGWENSHTTYTVEPWYIVFFAQIIGDKGVRSVRTIDLEETTIFVKNDSGTEQKLAALQALTSFPETLELSLSGDKNFNDSDMDSVLVLRNLKTLALSETNVSNSSVEKISTHLQLEGLGLDDTQIDEACVPYLCRMKSLEMLSLYSTNISSQGIAQIQNSLPNCATRYDDP